MAERPAQPEPEPVLPPEVRTAATEIVWRCSDCGHHHLADSSAIGGPAEGPPDRCPHCGAPREHFYRVTED